MSNLMLAFGSFFDVYPQISKPKLKPFRRCSVYSVKNDRKNIESDWIKVGDYLKMSMQKMDSELWQNKINSTISQLWSSSNIIANESDNAE